MPFPIPYLIIIILLGILYFFREKTEDPTIQIKYEYIAIAIFIFFFGLRGYILTDWMIYYPYFNDLEWDKILDYFVSDKIGYEPGFAFFTMTCKTLIPSYNIYILIITVFNTFCIVKFTKRYTDSLILVLILYITFDGVLIMGNLLRNSIAISLFLLAIPYLEERKPIQYFSLCLLGISFHISALVYIPLYFFLHRNINKWVYLSIFIFINLIFVTHNSVILILANLLGGEDNMADKVKAYTEEMDSSIAIVSLGYLERLMTGILIFLYYDKLKDLHNKSCIIINSVLIYFCIFFLMGEFEVVAKRFANLFIYGYWIIWIDLSKCLYYKNNKKIFTSFIIAYCMLRTWSYTNNAGFMYENILFGSQSYNERLYYHNRNFHED